MIEKPVISRAARGRTCSRCHQLIRSWRQREDGRWEPLGIDGLLHACRPRPWRRRRRNKKDVIET